MIFWLVLLSTFTLDHLTKWLATRQGLVLLNTGVSFNWLASVTPTILTLSLSLCVGALWLAFRRFWRAHPVAAGLFFGGAISNVVDRFLFNGVRDWLPIPFTTLHNNLADYALTLSIMIIGYDMLRSWGQKDNDA